MRTFYPTRVAVRAVLVGVVSWLTVADHVLAQTTITEEPSAPAVQPETPPPPPYSEPPVQAAPYVAPVAEPAPAQAAPPVAEAPAPDPNAGIVSFKPGKGLDIKSNDGNFTFNARLKTQLLNEVHKLKSADKATEDFFVRRMRLAFQGNVFSKDVKYKIEISVAAAELGRTDPRTAERLVAGTDPTMMTQATLDRDEVSQVPLLDAYFDFTQLRDLSIRIGQSKIPFGRERMWSDNEMIVVDRSLEDVEFNFDRDMVIDIRSSDFLGVDMLHYYLGVYVAEDRNSALNTLGRGDLGFIYNARIEFLPLGNFEEVAADFDRNKPKLSIGAAYAYLQTDANSPYARQSIGTLLGKVNDLAKVDYKVHNFTADALFKGGGLTLLTAFHYRKAVDLPSAAKQAKNGIGGVVQAAYLISNDVPLELQVNLGLIRAIKKTTSNTIPDNELGAGLNYYFNRHAIKLQAEVCKQCTDGCSAPPSAPAMRAVRVATTRGAQSHAPVPSAYDPSLHRAP